MQSKDGARLLSVDIGTTSAKAVLFRHESGIDGLETESYSTSYPRPGYVEQDPEEILAAVGRAIRRLVDNTRISPAEIDAIVFDGVWQSMVPVDRDGMALTRASIWSDTRSLPQNERLKKRLDTDEVKRRTGCSLHPMYFLSRLAWMQEEAPEVFQRAERFVSIKEYVIQHLFGVRKVDRSIASGTGLLNMRTLDWDADLLSEVDLTPDRFSKCVEPTLILPGLRRESASGLGLREGTPGVIGAADGAQSHLGSVGLAETRMSLTVGTGAALRRRMRSPGIVPGTEAWCYYLAEGNWLRGGVLHDAGNALRWFADTLMPPAGEGEDVFNRMNSLSAEIPVGAEGLCFIPLLGGERCPHYRPQAKGALYGLTFSHTRAHLVRALMEGLAYNLYSVYRMLVTDSEPDLVVTGGILKSPTWLQIVADFFGKTLWLPRTPEAAAWGGVLIGLRALGAIESLEESTALVDFAGKRDPDQSRSARYRDLLGTYEQLYEDLYGANRR
jgi:gluconokinase